MVSLSRFLQRGNNIEKRFVVQIYFGMRCSACPFLCAFKFTCGRRFSDTDYWEENQGDIYIPSMIDGYTVTTISSEAFANGNVVGASPCLLVLPNTITLIEDKAFFNSPITTVSIPSSLQSLGKGVFAYCSISQFIVDPSQANFAAIDGALYNKKTRTLLSYPQNSVAMTKVPEGMLPLLITHSAGLRLADMIRLRKPENSFSLTLYCPLRLKVLEHMPLKIVHCIIIRLPKQAVCTSTPITELRCSLNLFPKLERGSLPTFLSGMEVIAV